MTAARSVQSISGSGNRARACRKLPLVSSLVGRVGLSSLRATGTFLCGVRVVSPFAALAAVERNSTGKRDHGASPIPGNVRPDDLARQVPSNRATFCAKRQSTVSLRPRAYDLPASYARQTVQHSHCSMRVGRPEATAGIKGLVCPSVS